MPCYPFKQRNKMHFIDHLTCWMKPSDERIVQGPIENIVSTVFCG